MASRATLRRYNLTADQHARIVESQGNLCGFCGKEFTGTPHVDHDHKTGKVRGIVHAFCNRRRISQHDLTTAQLLINYMTHPPARYMLPHDHTVPVRKRRRKKRRAK